MSLLLRLGNYISTKANFLKASVLVFGVPFGIGLAYVVAPYGAPGVVMALLLGPVAGLVWGVAMWALLFKEVYARRRGLDGVANIDHPTSPSGSERSHRET